MTAVLTISAPGAQAVRTDTLPALLPAYIQDCIDNGIADSTRDMYRRQLQPFFEWLHQVGPPHDWLLNAKLLRQYPLHLTRDKQLAPATVETYCRRVRQLFKWLYKSGRLNADLSQWIPHLPDGQARTRFLTADEIVTLFANVAGGHRLRNMAMLSFFLETGARRIEAAHVEWGGVVYTEKWQGYAFLPRVKGYLMTDKRRTVAFGTTTGKLLQLLHVLQAPSADPRVFRISNGGIRQVFQKLSTKSAVSFSAHDLRRTFSTYWIRNAQAANPDLAERLLEMQLGHTSRSITRTHYMALTVADVLAHYVSPLDTVPVPGFA